MAPVTLQALEGSLDYRVSQKKMPHSELRLLGAYRDPLKLTLELITPIYDTRLCLGTITTLTLPYIVPYSPYSALNSINSIKP